jgi:hypothetical protein
MEVTGAHAKLVHLQFCRMRQSRASRSTLTSTLAPQTDGGGMYSTDVTRAFFIGGFRQIWRKNCYSGKMLGGKIVICVNFRQPKAEE